MSPLPHRLDVTHFKLFKNETYGKVKVADIFSYADAYDICCGRNTHKTAEVQCNKEDDTWYARLLRKSPLVSTGRATLYWAHMRKVCS
jgi:hypothetical protein